MYVCILYIYIRFYCLGVTTYLDMSLDWRSWGGLREGVWRRRFFLIAWRWCIIVPLQETGSSLILETFRNPSKSYLVGGIPTPLKNMKVSWDYCSHIVWKNKKWSKPPTNYLVDSIDLVRINLQSSVWHILVYTMYIHILYICIKCAWLTSALPFCELQLQLEIGTAGGSNSPKLKKIGEFQSYQDELIIICHSWSHSHGATTDKLVTQLWAPQRSLWQMRQERPGGRGRVTSWANTRLRRNKVTKVTKVTNDSPLKQVKFHSILVGVQFFYLGFWDSPCWISTSCHCPSYSIR
jgi:hypothetical protein